LTDEQTAGIRLLETGGLVDFKILSVQLHPGPDDGEFGVQAAIAVRGQEARNTVPCSAGKPIRRLLKKFRRN
jgi:hypothetical protein